MDIINSLLAGFEVAFTPMNLLYVILGVTVGTVTGLLPGLGPAATIALLLPLSFTMEPASAIIFLAGIYYGSMYGGRIPSILLNLPGDASAVITTLDGYPLRKQGRAGAALGITAIGSFIGGTVAIVVLTVLAPIVASFANKIGPPELFALTLLGIMMIALLSSGAWAKGLAAAGFGMLIASIGIDPVESTPRLTFGSLELSGGIGIVPLAVGLFGIGEVLYNAQHRFATQGGSVKVSNVLPTRADWLLTRMAIARASIIGTVIGLLPGGGGTVSSIIAYGAEKRFSKQPEKFGKGAMDGLAATETADNASSNAAFVPLLTLGIPPNPVLALMFGALLLQNITPGPQLVNSHPDIFWGVIASMYIGNVALLVLNLPMIRVFVQILKIPSGILSPLIVVIAVAGVYSVNNSTFDVLLAFLFGVLGYFLKKWQFSLGPLVLGFVLAPIMEIEFRRSLLISDGSMLIFLQSPIAATIIIGLALFAAFAAVQAWRGRRVGLSVGQDAGV